MPNRWWKHEGVAFELALTSRTPQLLIAWPRVQEPGAGRTFAWVDEAGIGLDLLVAGDGWPLVTLAAGPLTDAVRVALDGALEAGELRPPEERGRLIRTWTRTKELGFLPADLDQVDALTLTRAGASTESYEHQYGARYGEQRADYTRAELAAPDCPARGLLGPCLSRLDPWLALLG